AGDVNNDGLADIIVGAPKIDNGNINEGMVDVYYGSDSHIDQYPNWRVEGATNPFVVRLFPGWLRFGSSPFWIIVLTLNVFWYLSAGSIKSEFFQSYWYVSSILFTLGYAFIYRIQLNETHETFFLSIIKLISKFFGIKLIKDFEYVLYRTKLSTSEKNRLKYNTTKIEEILINIEDSRFYRHHGIDLKSFVRSFLSLFEMYRKRHGVLKSGGSTITMQLCRTLFIPSNQNPIFRKFVEILLSFWIENQFSKTEILGFYITSVRFEKGRNGIISATKYFFSEKLDKNYTNEEAFFLIERLSNISSTYRIQRVKSIFDRISNNIEIDWERLIQVYSVQENKKLITQYNNV
ncbi:MAG: transglycosylase domain-containing protein, partial [Bacteroidetes bacterium]|nr:transglycosylase domain-containing protein [Bacteroidota bacterium]